MIKGKTSRERFREIATLFEKGCTGPLRVGREEFMQLLDRVADNGFSPSILNGFRGDVLVKLQNAGLSTEEATTVCLRLFGQEPDLAAIADAQLREFKEGTLEAPRMLGQQLAVRVVCEYLQGQGYEIDNVFYKIGGTPLIRTKPRDQPPALHVWFYNGVRSCCGSNLGPFKRDKLVEHLKMLAEYYAHNSSVRSVPQPEKWRMCVVCVLSGTSIDNEGALGSVAAELGCGILLIDQGLQVISAGL